MSFHKAPANQKIANGDTLSDNSQNEKIASTNQCKENMIKLLTLLEASERFNLKVSRLRYEVFHKKIPHYKIGRSIRFSETDLISWIMNQKQDSKGGA